MANSKHLSALLNNVEKFNTWRRKNRAVIPDLGAADLAGAALIDAVLSAADLSEADLSEADLSEADLKRAVLAEANLTDASLTEAHLQLADLSMANLNEADLSWANLNGANLQDAILSGADLSNADLNKAKLIRTNLTSSDLSEANLRGANLSGANLRGADLRGANLTEANLDGADVSAAAFCSTTLSNVDLSKVKGLETVFHEGPSSVGIDTLFLSKGKIPEAFLRGTGVPDIFIEYAANLASVPVEFYSCFISYSSKDEALAKRLHADLQAKGVRCWFAPEDLKIGDKFRVGIDDAIRNHDKLLLLLSKHSVGSDWVEKEVESAFEKERKQKHAVLFPVRLDRAVMEIDRGWPADIRRTRHIGDFTKWKHHEVYQEAFDRLVRDLKTNTTSSVVSI